RRFVINDKKFRYAKFGSLPKQEIKGGGAGVSGCDSHDVSAGATSRSATRGTAVSPGRGLSRRSIVSTTRAALVSIGVKTRSGQWRTACCKNRASLLPPPQPRLT